MKRQIIFQFLLLMLICGTLIFPLQAQQGDCLPPVALPTATEPNIFSQEQEVYLGEAGAEQIQKNYHVIEDARLTGYLTRIGEQLNKNLPLTNLRFQFFLVDLPDANAFVLPGGRIYVSRKLVALAQSEDELAGVIAHELGHLVSHESAIDITRRFKEVLGVTEVTDRRDIFEKYNQLIDNFRRKPEAFKPRESGQMVADQAGFYALVKAGYDPAALARFWDRMTETKGRTGTFFSDLFGSTRPEERRLREMLKAVASLPPTCISARTAAQSEEFKQWQSSVISYTGVGRSESLHAVLTKQQLSPPLRSDISHIRFSPDGKYVLAQDDSGINILTREPFAPLFRIEAPDANPANFTPDSQSIVFYTDNLRVEYWSVAGAKMTDAKEVVVRKGCLQAALSPDGKFLACLNPDFELNLIGVASGQSVLQKKEFYAPDYWQYLMILGELLNRKFDGGNFGLQLISMGFSPDGHYFAAGYNGPLVFRMTRIGYVAEAFDLTTLGKVSLPDSLTANAKDDEKVDYGKNVTLEVQDARTLTPMWSKTYPKEAPRFWISSTQATAALLWDVTDEAAKTEIRNDARLSQQLTAMKEKEGDYFLEILDVSNGNPLGKLLIETGKGSFRLSNVFAAGDWVIIADTQNRVLVYSLKTGELKGRVFGNFATVSPVAGLMCVENESGQLTVYSLATMEKRDQFTFSSPASVIRFSKDGRRLFVLTSNQVAYILDVSTLVNSSAVKGDERN